MTPTTSSLPIPSGLKETLPSPQMPWNLSKTLFDRVRSQPENNKQYKTHEVHNTDPELVFILKYFEHQKPPGFGIKRIVCIHNPDQTDIFEAGLKNIEREVDNPIYAPKWSSETLPQQRAQVIERWRQMAQQFSPLAVTSRGLLTKTKVLPLWHGSNKLKCESICSSGFTFFGKHEYSGGNKGGSTDKGYFGSGIYFTNSARYAAMYSTEGILLLNWVSMREPYPVVNDVPHPQKGSDMRQLEGKEKYLNYNAHYIPVASTKPEDPKWMNYFPCYKDQIPAWDEFVVFEKFQTLPRFWIELGVDLPMPIPVFVKQPPSTPSPLKRDERNETGFEKMVDKIHCYATFAEHKSFFSGLAMVNSLALVTDNIIASGSLDSTIKFWDLSQGKCLETLKGHQFGINALIMIENGVLASGSNDKTIMLWDTTQRKCIRILEEHKEPVYSLAHLRKGLLASGSYDKTIKLWDPSKGKSLSTLEGHKKRVSDLTPVSDVLFASASEDKSIKVWDFAKEKCPQTFDAHKDYIHVVNSISNNLLVSGSKDKTIKLWDLSQGKCVKVLEGHKGWVCDVILLENNFLISGSADKTIKVWDLSQSKCIKTLEGHKDTVISLIPFANGLFASGSVDSTIKLWK